MIARAQAQVEAYPTVSTIAAEATAARVIDGGFEIMLAGGQALTARKRVLAFGISDVLPDIPGRPSAGGRACCIDGFEYSGKRMGVFRRCRSRRTRRSSSPIDS